MAKLQQAVERTRAARAPNVERPTGIIDADQLEMCRADAFGRLRHFQEHVLDRGVRIGFNSEDIRRHLFGNEPAERSEIQVADGAPRNRKSYQRDDPRTLRRELHLPTLTRLQQ